MLGHRLMGTSLLWMGAISEGRAYLDRAASMYNPTEHRQLAVRFGADIGVLILSHRSMALWLLGYPDSARADTETALSSARDLGQAATLMNALATASHAIFQSGDYSTSKTLFDELCWHLVLSIFLVYFRVAIITYTFPFTFPFCPFCYEKVFAFCLRLRYSLNSFLRNL